MPPVLPDQRDTVSDPQSIYQVVSMLQGVIRNGSARRAQSLKRKDLAAKTGTTNNEEDAWAVGFTPDLVVGVFVGFDYPRHMGHMEGGSRVALPIWIDFMKHALDGVPEVPFKMPSGMKIVKMDEMTGRPGFPGESGVISEVLKLDQELDSEPQFDDMYDDPYGYQNSYYQGPSPMHYGSPPYEMSGYGNSPAQPRYMPPAPSTAPPPVSAGGLY